MGAVIGLTAAVAGALALAYLLYYLVQESRKHRQRERAQFRQSLVHRLKKCGLRNFDYEQFVADAGLSRGVADKIACELYADLYQQCLTSKATEATSAKLSALAQCFHFSSATVTRLEERCKAEHFSSAVARVLADGIVTDSEAESLRQLRRALRLNEEQIFEASGLPAREGFLALFRRIAADRWVSPEEFQELERYERIFGMSEEDARSVIQHEAIELYRERFHEVIQDGEVSEEEEAHLVWLQKCCSLTDGDLEYFRTELAEVKRLAAFRQGKLPRHPTTKLLEGGEICHWEGGCGFQWKTSTMTRLADGNLLLTSKRVVFSSLVRSFSFAPAKIMDMRLYRNALDVQTAANKGTGRYYVQAPRLVEAILMGVVKKHKFLLSDSFASSLTRHIADDVKREVWHRDGGRCIRCGATEYLEFDHIIAHAFGGANTVQNVQILCRKCNLLKSDRI